MAKLSIIGIGGKAGSGKDTAADYLVKTYGGVRVAQADALKRILRHFTNFSLEQLWGTKEQKETLVPTPYVYRTSSEELYSVFKSESRDVVDSALAQWQALISCEKEISPRKAFQTLGTGMGRKLNPNAWSKWTINICEKLINGGYNYFPEMGLIKDDHKAFSYAFVSDLRFRNEINNINAVNGTTLKMLRDTEEVQNGVENHSSETELNSIPNHFWDELIDNNDKLNKTYYQLDQFMAVNYGDTRKWKV